MKTCSTCGAKAKGMVGVTMHIGEKPIVWNYCSVKCIKKSGHSTPVKKMLIEAITKEARDE